MLRTAFGRMKLLPEQFYDMEMEDFWLMYEGWHEGLVYEQLLFRKQTWIIHASLVKKPVPIGQLWPVEGEKKESAVDKKAEDMLRVFREKEAIKLTKQKLNNGRTSNTNRG